MFATIAIGAGVVAIVYLKLHLDKQDLLKQHSAIKKEWTKFAQDLNLETNMVDCVDGQLFAKNFEPYIRGLVDGYLVNIVFDRTFFSNRGLMAEIQIKTQQDFKFSLAAPNENTPFMPIQQTGDSFFDSKFEILSINKRIVKLLFQEDFRKKIISVFTTNMQGRIVFEPLKDDEDEEKYDKVLDDNIQINNNLLVYSEENFLMDNERQRLSFQRRFNLLLDMAKKIDSLEK